MGAEADVLIDVGYPFVDNDPALTEVAWQLANEYWGAENVSETELRMGAEDFGYYTHVVPGCFYRLGVGNAEKGIVHNVHTPKFNVDEDAISNGMQMMAWFGAKAVLPGK
jgi:hippurate hydrolase